MLDFLNERKYDFFLLFNINNIIINFIKFNYKFKKIIIIDYYLLNSLVKYFHN